MPDYENHYDKNDRYDDYNDVDDNVEDHDSQHFSSADHQCGPLPPCPDSRPNLPLITGDHHDRIMISIMMRNIITLMMMMIKRILTQVPA